MKNLFRLFLFISLSFFILPSLLNAAPPIFLTAEVVNEGNNYYRFHLTWESSGGEPNAFNVYVANVNTDDPQNTNFGSPLNYPCYDSVHVIQNKYVDFSGDGDFSIYITSIYGNTESGASNMKHIHFDRPPQTTISFTTSTDNYNTAVQGIPYSYPANAEANPSGTIVYALTTAPPGMTVNSNTGLITWSNPVKGKYSINLKASLQGEPTIYSYQSWFLTVNICQNFGTISGTIRDESNNIITSGTVYFYTNISDSGGVALGLIGNTSVNSGGSYSFNADEGDYYLQISGGTFDTEWYQNQQNQNNANPVNISCSQTATANFVVHALAPKYIISGRVTESDGTTPINRAKVHFYGINPGEVNPVYYNLTHTNSNGDYQMVLSSEYNYKVRASEPGKDSASGIEAYYKSQFWQNTDNPNNATLITLSGDVNNINFSLGDVPSNQNRIYGQVNGQNFGNNLLSWVIIFYMAGNEDTQYAIRTFDATQTSGVFDFSHIPNGTYIIQSIPVNDNYAYGYHKADGNGLTVTDWQQATNIIINSGNPQIGMNIVHPANNQATGTGIFSGKVGEGLIKIKSGDDKENGTILADKELAGAVVYVVTKVKPSIIKCAVTDHNGNFKIKGLPLDDYDIVVDKVGYLKSITNISITKDASTVNKNIGLEKYVSDVNEKNTTKTFALYPNPASDFVKIDYSAKSSIVKIRIINSSGVEIQNINYETQSGTGNILVNIKDFVSGTYLVILKDGNEQLNIPVIISR